MITFAINTIKSTLVQTTFKVKRLLIMEALLERNKTEEPGQKTKEPRAKNQDKTSKTKEIH